VDNPRETEDRQVERGAGGPGRKEELPEPHPDRGAGPGSTHVHLAQGREEDPESVQGQAERPRLPLRGRGDHRQEGIRVRSRRQEAFAGGIHPEFQDEVVGVRRQGDLRPGLEKAGYKGGVRLTVLISHVDQVGASRVCQGIHYNAGIDIDLMRGFQFSIEGYYKLLQNIPIVNDRKFTQADPDLLPGKGESYGWEFLMNYSIDPFNFTTSYTLSWAYKEVNNWTFYPKYDTRHAANIILEFNLGSGWIASSVWNYSSGFPFTELIGFYDKYFPNNNQNGTNEGEFSPYAYLGDKNLGRLPSYHRLDLSLVKRFSLQLVNFEMGVSAINVYDRQNIFYFNRDTGGTVNMLPFLLTGTIKVEI